MKKIFILLTSYLFLVGGMFAQEHSHKGCNHDHHAHDDAHNFQKCIMEEIIRRNVAENPALIEEFEAYEAGIEARIKEMRKNPAAFATKSDTLVNGKRIIPVVVHVIHNGGENNISKAQILDGIEKLNIDYARANEDTSETYELFKPRGANMDIEFRLARIDPDGNCTDGIDRVYDERTDFAFYNIMMDNSWPYSQYMNVYTVNFIQPEGIELPDGAMIGGLSPFTPDNALSGTGGDTLKDGVLIRHDCMGSIGTATDMGGMGMNINNQNRVFTHESGHFFNLYHPFQDITAMIAGSDGCGLGVGGIYFTNGDAVDDTPPVAAASQGCPSLTTNTCDREVSGYGDEPDMVQNYMDYASGTCQNIFTVGQKERVDETLMGTRRSLWSAENLERTGVLEDVTLCAPIADFSQSTRFVCAGTPVEFIDFSFNGEVEAWQWTFEGGSPATSTEEAPAVTYSTPGTYTVTLRVENAAGYDEVTKQAHIVVSDESLAEDLSYIENFESYIENDSRYFMFNQDGNSFETTDSVTTINGTNCLRLMNFAGNGPYSYDAFITPPLDMTQYSGGFPQLKFHVAYAGLRKVVNNPLTGTDDTTDVYDKLNVYGSKDCGKTWSVRYSGGAGMATVPISEEEFIPTSADHWKEITVNLPHYVFDDNVRLKFEFISAGGNNIFIDSLHIEGSPENNDDAVEELSEKFQLTLTPNPTRDNSQISFILDDKKDVMITVTDVLGKSVNVIENKQLMPGKYNYTISKDKLGSTGIYYVNFTIGKDKFSKKLVIVE